MPIFDEAKSSIYRQRNRTAEVQRTRTLNDTESVEVPQQYNTFQLADYYNDGVRIIVFCSADARIRLKELSDYFMDGTYKACPKPFRQIYVIQADIGSDSDSTNIVPLVYAFMSHQTTEAYTALFDVIKSQIPEWNPKNVTVDFERAVILALSKLSVEIHGCHYHFSNALYRKAKALGVKLCNTNRRIISLCSNLALLPEDKIKEDWAYVERELPQTQDSIKKLQNTSTNTG